MHRFLFLAAVLWAVLLFGFATPAGAQQILLDKQVPAGELLLYPEYKNEQNYYYLPNQPRLALDAEGRPQFSFIRFVRNSETGAEDSSTSRSSDGGGIVTALVELGVTEEQRNQAQQELQSLVPGAIIKGAVTYDSGKFSLNSVYADANGDRTEQVLGIGSAPLMEGNKAAISLDLTTKGAQQLWASFDMPSPNITFYFEMQFNGLLSPSEAVIEADYEKIYSHHALNVGAAGQVGKVLLGAEIDAAFKDLHRENAIRIDYVNADADMIAMTQIADKFIRDTIFKPMNENNQKLPGIEAATGGVAGAAGGQGLLDKASTLLKEARATADAIRGKDTAKATVAEQCEPAESPSGASATADKPVVKLNVEAKPAVEKEATPRTELAKSTEKKSAANSEIFTLDDDIAYIESQIEFVRSGGKYEVTEKALEEIKAKYIEAKKLDDAKEFAELIVLSHKSFDIRPHASAIFNIAHAYRLSGDTFAARVYYQLYLEFIEVSKKEITGKEDAEEYLEELPVSDAENSASSNYRRLMNGDLSDEHLSKLAINVKNNTVAATAVFDRAQNHVAAINYVEAGREFRNAYNLFASPDFIFNMAFSYQELDYPAEALQHYKIFQTLAKYLTKTTDNDADRAEWDKKAQKVQIDIDRLEKQLEENSPNSDSDESNEEIKLLEKKLAEQKGGRSADVPENVSAQAGDSDDKAKPAKAASPAAQKADCKPTKAKAAKAEEDNRPVLSIVARYKFRSEKQSGMYYMKINKYTNGTLNDNFAENIGDLSRLKDDEQFFRTVNLDDDLAYDQREIVVMLNGLNSSDFDNFINFASVKLRKRHESGAETIDDVRIDKANIDRTGNKFILLYGNKGDTNRERWLDYEFQTTWNFAGGHQEGDDTFQQSNGEAIALNPPIERLPLQIDADPDLLAAANVRAVDVKVFWTIGDQTDSEQVLLRLPNTSAIVPMLAPANSFGYEFEITWMRGNGLPDLRSGRQAGSSSILFVDDLPEQ